MKQAYTLEDLYLLNVVQKKSTRELAAFTHRSRNTILSALKRARERYQRYLPEQNKNDIIAFYESEIKLLIERRNKLSEANWKAVVAYTKRIESIQEKITDILGFINRQPIMQINQYTQIWLAKANKVKEVNEQGRIIAASNN